MLIEQKINLTTSATLAINEKAAELRASGKDIVHFGFGQSPFPVPALVQKSLAQNTHQKDYLSVKGLPILRRTISAHMKDLINLNYDPKNILVGPGSKQLIYLLQMVIDGPLLIPSPSWVSYAPQAEILKKKVHWIPTLRGEWKLKALTLDDFLIRNRLEGGLLILNYPSNPTGQTYEINELEQLAEVCDKHGLIVVADEIYGLIDFNHKYQSLGISYPEGTIICSGLSKWCGAGGWRMGYTCIPNELSHLADAMAVLASEMYSSVSAPIQYAAVTAFQFHTELEDYKSRIITILEIIAKWCYEKLIESKIILPMCAGGFYFFIDFENHRSSLSTRDIFGSRDLCTKLLEEAGVVLLPGIEFGRPEEELSARLAFVDFDGSKALEYDYSEPVNDSLIKQRFPNIYKGIYKIKTWINHE